MERERSEHTRGLRERDGAIIIKTTINHVREREKERERAEIAN